MKRMNGDIIALFGTFTTLLLLTMCPQDWISFFLAGLWVGWGIAHIFINRIEAILEDMFIVNKKLIEMVKKERSTN